MKKYPKYLYKVKHHKTGRVGHVVLERPYEIEGKPYVYIKFYVISKSGKFYYNGCRLDGYMIAMDKKTTNEKKRTKEYVDLQEEIEFINITLKEIRDKEKALIIKRKKLKLKQEQILK